MADRLSARERDEALADLTGWHLVEGRDAIEKTFEFANFVEAFGFMTRTAFDCRKSESSPRVVQCL